MDDLVNIDIIRKQRHDFMNVLQVVYGYSQMNKNDELESYINKIINQYNIIGEFYRLGDLNFAICMEKVLNLLWDKNIDVDLNFEIESFSKIIFDTEFDKKQILVNNIFKEFISLKAIIIYIDIYEDSNGLNISISNNPMLEEISISNMKRESKLDGLDIFKTINNLDMCYRIIVI